MLIVNTIFEKLKNGISDWWSSGASKRLLASAITAFMVTFGQDSGWITTDQAYQLAGLVIGLVIGDSYRPINPNKAKS
jgi:hypothetical protein